MAQDHMGRPSRPGLEATHSGTEPDTKGPRTPGRALGPTSPVGTGADQGERSGPLPPSAFAFGPQSPQDSPSWRSACKPQRRLSLQAVLNRSAFLADRLHGVRHASRDGDQAFRPFSTAQPSWLTKQCTLARCLKTMVRDLMNLALWAKD